MALLASFLLSLFFLIVSPAYPAIAQEQGISFNTLPPFPEAGEIGQPEPFLITAPDNFGEVAETSSFTMQVEDPATGQPLDGLSPEELAAYAGQSLQVDFGYDVARTWQAGDYPSDVLKLGDIENGFQVSQLTLTQIAELTGLNLSELRISEIPFLSEMSLSEFLSDVPGIQDFSITAFDLPSDVLAQLEGFGYSGQALEDTLISAIYAAPGIGDIPVTDFFGDLAVTDLPNFEFTQLLDFDGIADAAITDIPGLGDIPIEGFPATANIPGLDDIAGVINVFAMHDISFSNAEYSGDKPTPDPVSGGTNGGRSWQAIPCYGGCAHIELHSPGWEGANWMTKAHRVRDGYGLLGGIFSEAGAHRLPFGNSFAVQITSTDEAAATAEWGIAFRICQRFAFIDLGCTAYFLEVPLFLKTHEEQMVVTGIRDLRGGVSQPLKAPPGWEQERPAGIPPEVQEVIDQYAPPPPPTYGAAPVVMDEDCLSGILATTPTSQHDGAAENIPRIIEAANKHGLSRDQTAYVLATVRLETGPYGWAPIEEIGKPCGYDGGCGWHGRGYVQLTHQSNYEFVGRQLGLDLVNDPSLALDPANAAEILVAGMKNGWYNGQGHGLSYYINDTQQDWRNARRTVNILDKADTIGGWAQEYSVALSNCATLETSRPGAGITPIQPIKEYRTGLLSAQEYGAARPGGRRHAGQDFDITQGIDDEFQSYIGGVVTRVGHNPGGYGHYIDVYNAELGVVERIAEGSELLVGVGDTISPGQVVTRGESNTGVIHYEIRHDLNAQNQGGFGYTGTYDPIEFLEGQGIIRREGSRVIPLVNDQISP